MTTITQFQYDRLCGIKNQASILWKQLAALEEEAYQITGEEDKTGYTSDLILQTDMTPKWLLEILRIEVKDTQPPL